MLTGYIHGLKGNRHSSLPRIGTMNQAGLRVGQASHLPRLWEERGRDACSTLRSADGGDVALVGADVGLAVAGARTILQVVHLFERGQAGMRRAGAVQVEQGIQSPVPATGGGGQVSERNQGVAASPPQLAGLWLARKICRRVAS